jgi:hypothetical protein
MQAMASLGTNTPVDARALGAIGLDTPPEPTG